MAGQGFRVVNQLDESVWRDFVRVNTPGYIFQTPEMYRVYAGTHLHEPQLWAAVDEGGQPYALFLAVDISVFRSFPLRQMSTRSLVADGAVTKPGPEGMSALGTLLSEYRTKQRHSMFTEFRHMAEVPASQSVYADQGAAFEDHLNYLVDIGKPSEETWSRVKSSARRNIRKAAKEGVEVARIVDVDHLDRVHRILADTYQRIQVPLPDQSLFRSAFEVLTPRDELFLLAAFLGDEMIGALFLLVCANVATYWYTGSLREYSGLRANDVLVWEGMLTAREAGATVFDFGGAGKPDEDYGVRDFKSKFGGELVNPGRNVMIHSPVRFKLSTAAYERLSRFL
jgi:hypothetical protein